MPKKAARLWLKVTKVRVERIGEITWDDAVAEGWPGPHADCDLYEGAVEWFKYLWDSLNKHRGYGWDTNPWVAAYDFERIDR